MYANLDSFLPKVIAQVSLSTDEYTPEKFFKSKKNYVSLLFYYKMYSNKNVNVVLCT